MAYSPTEIQVMDLSDEEFRLFVLEELKRISIGIKQERPVILHSAPRFPYNGLVVIADGTDWNPGSGVGYYGYKDGSWLYLG